MDFWDKLAKTNFRNETNLERKTYLIANIRGQRIDQRIGMSGNKSVTSLGLNAST